MVSHRHDPDLHRAISLRPSPFHSHPDRIGSETLASSSASASSPTAITTTTIPATPALPAADPKSPAQSTSYEIPTAAGGDMDPASENHQRATFTRSSSESSREDVEAQTLPTYNDANDPYSLRNGLKSVDEIDGIKANISRKRTGGCPGPLSKPGEKLHERKLKGFYEAQNENIERLLKPVDQHRLEAKEEQGSDALQFKIAVRGSFAANIILAVLQIYGASSSDSLSLFTTMADAIFDPLSNLTLILCHNAVNKVNPMRFPSGKARIETAGNIAFCFLMTSVSLILIVVSTINIAGGSTSATGSFHLPSVIAVAIAFCTKLGLFLYCWALRNKYSQVRILWEDHRNDLFINGFGLLTSVGGSKLRWWIDPMGAILLSVLISFLWLSTAYSEFQLLIGVTAEPSFLQHITYISMTHSPMVVSLDTVRAWHSGPRLIVEVDVVMDRDQTLQETHDCAEALQIKLESLPNVERAYVHVDYETDHAPEHFLKKEL